MLVKSKKLKVRNLPKNDICLDSLCNKPYIAIFILLGIGIAMLWLFYYIGLAILILSIFLLLKKPYTLVSFYDEYAVFYLDDKHEDCFLLYWNDVASWQIINNQHQLSLNIILNNQQQVVLNCLSKQKIVKYFVAHLGNPVKSVACK